MYMPITENGVGHSQYSVDKQIMFRSLAAIHLKMSTGAMLKYHRPNSRYYYFDLHAGPGVVEQYGDGSPLVFLEIAEKHKENNHGFRYSALMVDENQANIELLRKELDRRKYYNAAATCANNNDILWEYAVAGYYEKTFGLFYCDPTTPLDMPWDGLSRISHTWLMADILLRLPATSFKRCQHHGSHKPLSEYLSHINKQNKSILDPEGKHQWTFVYLTNGRPISWPGRNFYDFNSRNGQRVWDEITKTTKERHGELQPTLF